MFRLIVTILVATMAVTAITIGTLAAFSDTATDDDNILQAGTITLTVAAGTHCSTIGGSELAPNSVIPDCATDLTNNGNLAATAVLVSIAALGLNDAGGNACTNNPEDVAEGNTTVCATFDLDTQISIDDILYDDDNAGGPAAISVIGNWDLSAGVPCTVGTPGNCNLNNLPDNVEVNVGSLGAGKTGKLTIMWRLDDVDNTYQGDQADVDLTFKITQ